MKDKLPEQQDLQSCLTFILSNLSEMTRLWIRLSYLPSLSAEDREIERNELRVTVGENLIRLGGLDSLTYEMFRDIVLPKILDIVVICKDAMAQQYLLDCLIQVFPNKYLLKELEAILEATSKVKKEVEIKNIMINLIEKITEGAVNE